MQGGGGGGTGRRREDKSEKALLTLAVSQAICVTMLHILLEGRSAGNRDITVSRGKETRPGRARRKLHLTEQAEPQEKLLPSEHPTKAAQCYGCAQRRLQKSLFWNGIKEHPSGAPGA